MSLISAHHSLPRCPPSTRSGGPDALQCKQVFWKHRPNVWVYDQWHAFRLSFVLFCFVVYCVFFKLVLFCFCLTLALLWFWITSCCFLLLFCFLILFSFGNIGFNFILLYFVLFCFKFKFCLVLACFALLGFTLFYFSNCFVFFCLPWFAF